MSLEGKTAVITGASRGIGASVARMLHERGVNLGLASRSGDDLGLDGAVARETDVRDFAAVQAICDETAERFGGIDIVVANAGVGAYAPFLELSLEHIDEMVDVNLKGTIYTIRAALLHMLGREGDVITLASEAGRRGFPTETVYCASKFGQVGLTRALDHELRPQGIRATNVCPGGVATDFALEPGRGRKPGATEGMMTADDVAELVLFVLERPRHLRILEAAFRPMTEASWG
jgi:3-oxoacyl-[acyl-carrier protein] reductase